MVTFHVRIQKIFSGRGGPASAQEGFDKVLPFQDPYHRKSKWGGGGGGGGGGGVQTPLDRCMHFLNYSVLIIRNIVPLKDVDAIAINVLVHVPQLI